MIKRGKFLVLLLLTFGTAIAVTTAVKAQCAMCSASVESNSQAGKTTANGLNNGIMFLLAAPYLAVGVVGYVWYKKYRRKNVVIDMRDQPLHLN
jgi:hypothetical protein